MKYLGKKYLYNFLKQQGRPMPQLKYCYYARWRGDEWIKTDEYWLTCYNGKKLNLTVASIDKETGEKICELETIAYVWFNDKWCKSYHHDFVKNTLWYARSEADLY